MAGLNQSGALLLSFTTLWILGSFAMNALSRSDLPDEQKGKIGEAIRDVLDDEQALMERLPLDNLPILKDHNLAPYYGDFLAHPDGDEYWSRWNIARFFDNISIPVLALSGWYDMFLGGTLRNFLGMQRRATAPQRLVIGPWHHGRPLFGPSPNPEIGFGVHAGVDVDGMAVRWFDRWLKGVDNGADSESPLDHLHVGEQPVADRRLVAATRRYVCRVLPSQRWRGEWSGRRWSAFAPPIPAPSRPTPTTTIHASRCLRRAAAPLAMAGPGISAA